MLRIIADVKPDADIAYLSAAITHAALSNKFRELFGREPVQVGTDEAMHVDAAKVPEIVLSGVDHDIIPILSCSAVEQSKNAEQPLPEEDGSTMLYTIQEDTPAKIALESVAEYAEMDAQARESVIADAAAQETLNIEDGVAYLSKELSTIEIGVYVDHKLFAEAFQARLMSSGGEQLPQDAKLKIFDELLSDLPGGESNREQIVRSELLTVVGMGDALPAGQRPVAEDMVAPGPGSAAQPTK